MHCVIKNLVDLCPWAEDSESLEFPALWNVFIIHELLGTHLHLRCELR